MEKLSDAERTFYATRAKASNVANQLKENAQNTDGIQLKGITFVNPFFFLLRKGKCLYCIFSEKHQCVFRLTSSDRLTQRNVEPGEEERFCSCNKISDGDMVQCDNDTVS